jgi:hypothetical protein
MASSLNAATSGGGGVIVTSDASGDLNIQSGGSTVVAVTSAGVAVTGTLSSSGASTFTGTGKFATTIGVGNATPAASGSGITFPATQSASSDANTLDDYEEGTWTPAVGAQTGSVTSYTSSATYTKVGRLVNLYVTVSLVNVGTASDRLIISNSPFVTSGASSISNQPATILRESASTGVGYLVYQQATTNQIAVQTLLTNTGITWSNGTTFSFTLTIQI